MSQINDAKYAAINLTDLSINDEYFAWLGISGGVGATVSDREISILSSKVTSSAVNDMWYEYLGILGHTEAALSNRMLAFWEAGAVIP